MSLSKRSSRSVSPARGAILVVGMRWIDRLIGVVSTLILARLLLPADFGIVAMASVVVGLVDTLLDLGVGSALVQNKNAGRDEYDTAWTLRLAQAGCAAIIIWIAAPWAAEYFRDPRVANVVAVMAVTILIGGFENIGIVSFQKNMEFGRDFQFFFFRRISGFLVTIGLAFWLHSYWAMVIGAVVGRSAGVIVSYLLHEYRPRFSLASAGRIWSFSQWILVRNLGVYGLAQFDKFLIGRRTDASTMGAYSVADEIAAIPTTELLAPLGRVLFPVFVKAADDPAKLRSAFCKAIGVQALLALPAGAGLCLIADHAVLLLLGEKWWSAVPLLQTLALISVFSALTHSSSYLLLALGKVGVQATLAWLQLFVLVVMAIVLFPDAGAQAVAYLRLVVTMLGLMMLVGLVLYYVEVIRLGDFLVNSWRPLMATGVMAIVLVFLPKDTAYPLVVRLFGEIALGGAVYGISLLLLWRSAGACEGAESYLLDQLKLRERVLRWMRVKT